MESAHRPTGEQRRAPDWIVRLGFIVACAALSGILAAISLAIPHSGAFAALWLPNAVILGAAMATRRVDFPWVLAGTGAGLIFGELVGGVSFPLAAVLTCANVAEIALAMLLIWRWCGPRLDFTDAAGFFRFVGAALLAAAGATALATVLSLAFVGVSGLRPAEAPLFFARHAGSMLFLAPLVLVAIDAWRARGRDATLVPLPILAIVIGGSLAIFGQSQFPLLFLATPLVVLAGISSGIGGTAFAMLAIAIVAGCATALGSGPITLTRGGDAMALVSLQLFLASLTLVGLPLAGLIERRRRDREALRISHDEKRLIMDNVDEVIFAADREGRWQTLNRPWERITGIPRSDSLGQPIDCFLPETERARLGERIAALNGGALALADCELWFEHPDGEVRHVEMRMRLARDPAGMPTGIVGHMRDITEIVARRQALDASERQFATLAEVAPAGLYITDAAGACTWVNSAWIENTGLVHGEWQGAGWADAVHPDDKDRIFRSWHKAVSACTRFEDEWRWLRPDGTIRWVRSAGTPQLDGEGRITGFIGINMDITSSRRAEQELAERDRRIRAITDNLRDALFLIGRDGCCRYASPFAATMFGTTPEALVGQNFADLFDEAGAAQVRAGLAPLWSGGERDCAMQMPLTDGPEDAAPVWIDAHFAVVDSLDGDAGGGDAGGNGAGGGEVDAIVASLRDVSEAKQLEEALTAARRRAEHAARAKATFLANMSHEIRTPMNGVIGFTELLLDSELSAPQRRNAQMIADSGRAMMGLLNDILDMSKIDSGQMTIAPAPVDIRAKIATCLELLTPVASRAGIALTADVDAALPERIVSDPLRLRQILLNLIGNAVKFTERGGVAVDARVEYGRRDEAAENGGGADGSGRTLVIAVADTGIGIPAERLEYIFGQFQQADGSVARRYGGTGLGLAISSSLARLMGGTITVSSTLGEGTTFTLRLPLVAAADDAAAQTAADAALAPWVGMPAPVLPAPVTFAAALEGAPRVLVAEDNDINQELVLAMVRRIGLDPDLAQDGAEAVAMVEAARRRGEPYRLVLMDMQMPTMGGLEATRLLRERGHDAAELPIIALTANCFAEDIAACREAGMQGHLAKPLQTAALVAVLTDHLLNPASAAQAVQGDKAAKIMPRVAATEVASPAPAPSAEPLGVTDPPVDGLLLRYRERKAGLLRELADVASGKGDPQWDELAMQLHKLAGTAGYFGEARLGELARELEDGLRRLQAGEQRAAMVRDNWDKLRAVA